MDKLKKLKTGERIGTAATIMCFVVTAAFIALFSCALALENTTLKILSFTVCPVLLLACIGVSAFCNLKYVTQKEKLIEDYMRAVLIENAALLHPERNSLTFYVNVSDRAADIKVNGYKDKISFDLSALGKLSAAGKSEVAEILTRTLSNTFCKLYDRGAEYKDVGYLLSSGKKERKPVAIIANGTPDKKCYKNYLKSKNA